MVRFLLTVGVLSFAVACGHAGPPQSIHKQTSHQTSFGESAESTVNAGLLKETTPDQSTQHVLKAAGIDPELINCNSDVIWVKEVAPYADRVVSKLSQDWNVTLTKAQRSAAKRVVLGYSVRLLFEQLHPQNLGVMRLKDHVYTDKSGKPQPLLVFRSGVTTDASAPKSCFQTLIQHAHVRHVVNLYDGDFPLHDFVRAEAEAAKCLGATHYDVMETTVSGKQFRNALRTKDAFEQNSARVMKQVANLIKQRILSADGKPLRGNVYLHCAGGMHRSGMMFGILRRCINHDSYEAIEAEYKRHTAYHSDKQPGGFDPLNLRFIREFDCSLLSN